MALGDSSKMGGRKYWKWVSPCIDFLMNQLPSVLADSFLWPLVKPWGSTLVWNGLFTTGILDWSQCRSHPGMAAAPIKWCTGRLYKAQDAVVEFISYRCCIHLLLLLLQLPYTFSTLLSYTSVYIWGVVEDSARVQTAEWTRPRKPRDPPRPRWERPRRQDTTRPR